jgi:hypothetical protein
VPVAALEEVLHLQTQLGEHILRFAPGKAVHKRPPLVAPRDGEAGFFVVVRGAQGLVALAPLLYAFQAVE